MYPYADCLLKNMSTKKCLDYSKSHLGDMPIIDISKIIPTALTPYTTCPKKNQETLRCRLVIHLGISLRQSDLHYSRFLYITGFSTVTYINYVLLYYFDIGNLLHIINIMIYFAFPLEICLIANIFNISVCVLPSYRSSMTVFYYLFHYYKNVDI